MEPHNDLKLVRQCIDSTDESAWAAFVEQYSRLVWSGIQKTFRTYFFRCSQEDVEDVFSSVFLSLVENDFRKLRQYRSENSCSLSTYLTVVTVRVTIDFMRSDKRHLFAEPTDDEYDLLLLIPDEGQSAMSRLEEQQRRQALREAISSLPEDDRMLCALFCRADCPPETAARLLGLPVEAVYTRKNRIIGKLKKIIADMQENPARTVL